MKPASWIFFIISSYFCPPAYDKKGAGAFAKDKLKRLGIPFLFYFAVLNPILRRIVCAGQNPVKALWSRFRPTNPVNQSQLALWNRGLAGAPSASEIRTNEPAKMRM